MTCTRCQFEMAEDANFCQSCGTDQRVSTTMSSGRRPLRRSGTNRKIAGVCGGLAEYFDVDATLIRVLWAVLAIVPPVFAVSVVLYLVAWLVMPGEKVRGPVDPSRPLTQSATNRKLGGVCGGLGEYFGVDPTAVRLLWVVMSIVPGVIVGGIAAYLLAWLVMPVSPQENTNALVSDEVLGV